MTFILCAIKDACAAKQAHKWSIICRQRCEWMLHPVIETSNSSIKVTLSLTYTIANTHLLAGLFLSPKVANRHCARLVFLWHVHKHTDSSAAERLVPCESQRGTREAAGEAVKRVVAAAPDSDDKAPWVLGCNAAHLETSD